MKPVEIRRAGGNIAISNMDELREGDSIFPKSLGVTQVYVGETARLEKVFVHLTNLGIESGAYICRYPPEEIEIDSDRGVVFLPDVRGEPEVKVYNFHDQEFTLVKYIVERAEQ
ncbi:MAG: hypothetical protein KJ600_00640 [Nanoarchaeota archaeon]|nr:hypothetical protein [Nanoarchaeota archaeon]MBU1103050.1 hypothetical protein [Nanoarchaeota archaeon]